MAGELSIKQGGSGAATAATARTALGMAGIGGVTRGQTGRLVGDATGTVDVAHGLGVTPKAILFFGVNTGVPGHSSVGYAYGAANFWSLASDAGVTAAAGAAAINIQTGGAGWTATVTVVDATKFTLSWVEVGAKKDVTVDWIAFG